jgi:hypothetical protein
MNLLLHSHFTVVKKHKLGEKFISIQDPNTILWAFFNMYLSTTAVTQVLQQRKTAPNRNSKYTFPLQFNQCYFKQQTPASKKTLNMEKI